MKYLAAAVIFVLFAVGVVLAPLVCLASLLVLQITRAENIFKAMNRLCGATYFGFDGKQTISKTCGERLQRDPTSEPCCTLCAKLEVLEDRHCEKEAAA